MSKKVTSVNLDEDLAHRVSSDESINLSGTVNKLLRQYLDGDADKTAMLELREDQLESEIASLESELETKRDELARVRDALNDQQSAVEQVVAKAVEEMGIPPNVGHDHAAARNWAEKANLPVEEFWSRYTEAYDE